MYHPDLIAAHEERLLSTQPGLRRLFPTGIPRPSIADTRTQTLQISRLQNDDGTLLRALTAEEEYFVAGLRLRVMFDAPYFLESLVYIDQEGHGLRPLYPLWESQIFVLARLADQEQRTQAAHSPDGLLFNILKVRQVGVSTLASALLAHRVLTSAYTRALVGSDVEEQAGYLFRMSERIYRNLPWFLRPEQTGFNKDRELLLGNASSIRTAWGKSTRGALQEVGGVKGHLGRGRTYGTVQISELATWDNPGQLDTALLPGIPVSPLTLVLFESTAELADDWWNKQWETAKEGVGRFSNIFLPWYVESEKYSLLPPEGWTPNPRTAAVADKAERESPTWCAGRTLRPSLAQLYWYESTRAFYEKKGKLGAFLREYPTDDHECFQYAGQTIFTVEQLDLMDQQARPLLDVWAVEPSRDIAELKRLPPEGSTPPAPEAPRRAPPISLRLDRLAPDAHPVPPGYGFRRLPPVELADLPNLRASVLAIWEYPRLRGSRRYLMAVDVGDGIGQDYSVIDILRIPTVEEPAEQVAQYISNRLSASQLGYVCDALGRYYLDEDGIEALAAIECNIGPGIATQNTLQLHLGYTNFYVWEIADAASPEKRYTQRIGWATTARTRPIILAKFHESITTADPISGMLDLRLNSQITRQELRHLLIPPMPGARLGDAVAAAGHHDDAVMAAAIANWVGFVQAGGESEPIDERRRRRAALQAYHTQTGGPRRDYRNTDIEADKIDFSSGGSDGRPGDDDDDLSTPSGDSTYFDPRASDSGGYY